MKRFLVFCGEGSFMVHHLDAREAMKKSVKGLSVAKNFLQDWFFKIDEN